MAETKYISYGLNLLPLDKVMTALADRVDSYLDSQPFSNKVKNRWKELYMDVINNKGLLGASNQNGIWEISHGGDSTDNVSQRDKAIYGDIAYYILLTMSNIDSSTKKEEELKKAELEKFGSFDDNFKNYITKYKYRGRDWSNDWVNLDTRDASTGLLNTTNRINELKKYLLLYKESLKDYDYEGSSFDNADDLKNSIDAAIHGLNNGDVNAISLVGLDPKEWLYNGAEDIAGTDAEGNKYTYSQLAQLNLLKAQQQAEAEEAKKQAIILNNKGIDLRVGGIHAVEAKNSPEAYANWLAQTYGVGQQGFNGINNRVQELIDAAYSSSLTNSDKKELGNLLFYIRKNNPNYNDGLNLSDEEWAELNKHSLTDKNRDSYIHLPWKTNGKDVYADGQGNLHILKNQNNAKLPTAFKKSLAAVDYRNNFLKTPLLLISEKSWKDNKGILISDFISMLGDLVSLGGGAAGVAGGATSLLADVSSDIQRGKNLRDIAKGIGKNALWTIAGVIPGAKLGKISRNAARLWAGINSLGIISDPNIHKSWNKLINGQNITAQDVENFKYTLHAIAGGTNVARGVATLRKINQALGKETISVKTKSGIKSATKEQINEINKVGRQSGLKAAENKFKDIFKEEAAEGSFKFGESSRSRLNPARYTSRITSDKLLKGEKSKVRDNAAIQELINIDKAKPWFWLAHPFKAKTWSDFITASGSNRGTYSYIFRQPTLNTTKPINPDSESLKLLPLIKSKYVKPNSEYEPVLRVESGKARYERPSSLQRSTNKNTVNNESKKSLKSSLEEIKTFKQTYINTTKGKKSIPFGNGYGTNIEPLVGKYKFPNETPFEISKDLFGNFELKIGNNKPLIFNTAQELRSTLALRVNKLLKNHEKVKQNADWLIYHKSKGLFKQGGQINNNIDNIISEFLASKLI